MKKRIIFATAFGGMAEWSNAAVLKTVEGHTSGGSNPSSSAELKPVTLSYGFFVLLKIHPYIHFKKSLQLLNPLFITI